MHAALVFSSKTGFVVVLLAGFVERLGEANLGRWQEV
jgi:hypothetical protein|tara:strand:- start:991 stop:1101 length:111 start_codon:yes stop_codon:yes gene_type:complete